jgi:hypothetical protein
VLSDEIGWNNEENHEVIKGSMVGHWGAKFCVI